MKRSDFGSFAALAGSAVVLATLAMTGRESAAADTGRFVVPAQRQQAAPGATEGRAVQTLSRDDLELVGVEIWVENSPNEGLLPHRRIYAGSQLRVWAYFRNSGVTTIDLQNLNFEVTGAPSGAGGSLGNASLTSIKPREEQRAMGGRSFTLPAGIQTLTVTIDGGNRLHELNETNNQKTIQFDVFHAPVEGIPFADCGVREFTAKFTEHPLRWHVEGDTDMHGHGPTVIIEGELSSTETRLMVRGRISMSEGDSRDNMGDLTEFQNLFNRAIFQAPQGCRIKKVEALGNFSYINPLSEFGRIAASLKGSKQWKTVYTAPRGQGPQLFQSAVCLGDTDGSEANKIGCKDIALMPLRVHLERVTGPVCLRRQQYLPGHAHTSYINRGFVGVYPLTRTRGDGEMGRNPINERINIALKSDQYRIWTEHAVSMTEDGGDHSTFQGSHTDVLFDARQDAPGCMIRGITPGGSGGSTGGWASRIGNDSVFRHNWHSMGPNGLLKHAWCRADTKGNDTGDLGCKEIEYSVPFLNVDLWPTQVLGPPFSRAQMQMAPQDVERRDIAPAQRRPQPLGR